jgi:sporulation protein YunB
MISGGVAMRRWRRYGMARRNNWRAVLILVLFLGLIMILDSQLRPIILSITTNQARIKSVDTINSAVTKELNEHGVTYNDIITVERSDAGEVLSITTNMVKMNELKAAIISNVQKQLSDENQMDMGVPLGTLLGNDLLHGYGPNVPIRLTLSGNVIADFKSSFESAGINQTKHQIYLSIHTSVYSFIPGFNSTTDVETNIPVAETIIVGQVPEVVANLK